MGPAAGLSMTWGEIVAAVGFGLACLPVAALWWATTWRRDGHG